MKSNNNTHVHFAVDGTHSGMRRGKLAMIQNVCQCHNTLHTPYYSNAYKYTTNINAKQIQRIRKLIAETRSTKLQTTHTQKKMNIEIRVWHSGQKTFTHSKMYTYMGLRWAFVWGLFNDLALYFLFILFSFQCMREQNG